MDKTVRRLKKAIGRCKGPCYECSALYQEDGHITKCLVGFRVFKKLRKYEPLMSFKIDGEDYGKYLVKKLKEYSKEYPDPNDVSGIMGTILKAVKS